MTPNEYRDRVALWLHDNAGNLLVQDDRDRGLGLKFPGGGIDPGQSVNDAAIREALEEVGYSLADKPKAIPGVRARKIEWDPVFSAEASAKGRNYKGSKHYHRMAQAGERDEALLGSEGDALKANWMPIAEVLEATRSAAANPDNKYNYFDEERLNAAEKVYAMLGQKTADDQQAFDTTTEILKRLSEQVEVDPALHQAKGQVQGLIQELSAGAHTPLQAVKVIQGTLGDKVTKEVVRPLLPSIRKGFYRGGAHSIRKGPRDSSTSLKQAKGTDAVNSAELYSYLTGAPIVDLRELSLGRPLSAEEKRYGIPVEIPRDGTHYKNISAQRQEPLYTAKQEIGDQGKAFGEQRSLFGQELGYSGRGGEAYPSDPRGASLDAYLSSNPEQNAAYQAQRESYVGPELATRFNKAEHLTQGRGALPPDLNQLSSAQMQQLREEDQETRLKAIKQTPRALLDVTAPLVGGAVDLAAPVARQYYDRLSTGRKGKTLGERTDETLASAGIPAYSAYGALKAHPKLRYLAALASGGAGGYLAAGTELEDLGGAEEVAKDISDTATVYSGVQGLLDPSLRDIREEPVVRQLALDAHRRLGQLGGTTRQKAKMRGVLTDAESALKGFRVDKPLTSVGLGGFSPVEVARSTLDIAQNERGNPIGEALRSTAGSVANLASHFTPRLSPLVKAVSRSDRAKAYKQPGGRATWTPPKDRTQASASLRDSKYTLAKNITNATVRGGLSTSGTSTAQKVTDVSRAADRLNKRYGGGEAPPETPALSSTPTQEAPTKPEPRSKGASLYQISEERLNAAEKVYEMLNQKTSSLNSTLYRAYLIGKKLASADFGYNDGASDDLTHSDNEVYQKTDPKDFVSKEDHVSMTPSTTANTWAGHTEEAVPSKTENTPYKRDHI
jgi:8-oxo-dGTP pyrophosphatase MutT (NUDIX family)